MPTYAYACTSCGHRFDIYQAFSDDPLTECPECGGVLRKQFGNIGVVFKGSGFYRNDARGTSTSSEPAAAPSPSTSSSSESSSSSSAKESSSKDSGGKGSSSKESSTGSSTTSSGSTSSTTSSSKAS